jgi:hypothetical protein
MITQHPNMKSQGQPLYFHWSFPPIHLSPIPSAYPRSYHFQYQHHFNISALSIQLSEHHFLYSWFTCTKTLMFFFSAEVWTQELVLARPVIYHLSHTPTAPLTLVSWFFFFFQAESYTFCPNLTSYCSPLTYDLLHIWDHKPPHPAY